MNHEIVIITVPHTGTNYAKSLFRQRGWEDVAVTEQPREGKSCFYAGHMIKDTQVMPALELAKTRPLVIPLRHPYRVELSWDRRGKDKKEMFQAFDNLLKHFDPLNPFYIPVDEPKQRRIAVQEISDSLGIALQDTGEIVNSKAHTYDVPFDDITPSPEVIELAKRPKTNGSTRHTGSH